MGRGCAPGGHARRPGVGPLTLRRLLRNGLRDGVDLLLPGRCLGCRERIPPGGRDRFLCPPCRTRLRPPAAPRCPRCHLPVGTGRVPGPDCLHCRPWPEVLVAARWAVALEPPADALVHGLKYEGWRGAAAGMAERMARLTLPPAAAGPVVPVPTTRKRTRRRGYNQAGLLARELGARLGIAVVPALARREGRATQVALHPDERRANVRDAFVVRPGEGGPVAGRHTVLVDDVLTTGATASAAAEALERAGATGVTVVAFARALPGDA